MTAAVLLRSGPPTRAALWWRGAPAPGPWLAFSDPGGPPEGGGGGRTRRCLVVATRTADDDAIRRCVVGRATAGVSFHVVVPRAAAFAHTAAFALAVGGCVVVELGSASLGTDADREAADRLRHVLGVLDRAGVPSSGEIGAPDPVRAVGDAITQAPVDEILVASRSGRLARWLRVDLSSRVARRFGLPVSGPDYGRPDRRGRRRGRE